MSDYNFKYLSEEFSHKQLKLVKQKGVYPYEYMDSFKRFSEDKLPDKNIIFSLKDGNHISGEEYLHTVKAWNEFNMKNLGEYHDNYLEKGLPSNL